SSLVLASILCRRFGKQREIPQTKLCRCIALRQSRLAQGRQSGEPTLQNFVSTRFQNATRLGGNDWVRKLTLLNGSIDMLVGESSDDPRHPGGVAFGHPAEGRIGKAVVPFIGDELRVVVEIPEGDSRGPEVHLLPRTFNDAEGDEVSTDVRKVEVIRIPQSAGHRVDRPQAAEATSPVNEVVLDEAATRRVYKGCQRISVSGIEVVQPCCQHVFGA